MKTTLSCPILSLILVVLLLATSWKASSTSIDHEDFLQCLESSSHHESSKPQVYVPKNVAYSSILESSINNLRFTTPTTSKPQFIITPNHESQVQAVVICSKKHGLQIRVRSGGHDFEGLSYTSNVPFVLIDLIDLRAIDIDMEDNSAWFQAGATLGEVYYRIAEKSPVHGFPGGACPTVGSGGHISGGGFGALVRKYGMAAEYVLDARLVDVKGEVLNRETMGEDLFWAIRGGGVASFGVLLAWKIKLVPVPRVVTVSMIDRTLEQGATDLVRKWQSVASYEVPKEVFIALHVTVVDKNATSIEGFGRTVRVTFQVLFLGTTEKLMQLMEDKFPELEMKKKDCREMSWIESTIGFAGFQNGTPINILLNRNSLPKTAFKAKSDFVTKPIPKAGLEGIWKRLLKEERPELLIAPWGGKVNEVSEHKIPFPHRAGNMYLIDYVSNWDNKEGMEESEKHISWIRELHDYMTPYVSKSPRAAFFNYKDLDLGKGKLNGTSNHSEARIWGHMYFKSNFEKLVKVKSKVDPTNFFTNEQSIPTVGSMLGRKERV